MVHSILGNGVRDLEFRWFPFPLAMPGGWLGPDFRYVNRMQGTNVHFCHTRSARHFLRGFQCVITAITLEAAQNGESVEMSSDSEGTHVHFATEHV